MADAPKPGRAKPILERFELSEVGLTARLTDEQKTWKVVKLRPRAERFEMLAESCPSEGPIPEPEPTAQAEHAVRLRAAIAGLPDREREAITLHLQGVPLSEIARQMAVTADTVAALTAQARQRLGSVLGPGAGETP